jgi:hypothetical protein
MGELLGFVGQQYALSGLLRLSFGATDVEGGGRAVSAGRARNCHFYPALPWRAFTYRRFTAGVWLFYSAGFPQGRIQIHLPQRMNSLLNTRRMQSSQPSDRPRSLRHLR